MSLRDFHPHLLEALAVHEALRRCGLSPDDIYLGYAPRGGALQVVLRAQGRQFVVDVAAPGDFSVDAGGLRRAWEEAVAAWNGGEESERRTLWEGSKVYARGGDLVCALVSKGFRLGGAR